MKASPLYVLGCIVLFCTTTLQAQFPSQNLPAYQHLYEINKEWQHYPAAAPSQEFQFQNDTKRIRFHLELVIQHLKTQVPKGIKAQNNQKRQQLLDELQHYAQQEIFPINLHHSNRQPYFIDHKGTHCAVGYLMKVSGSGALAQQISEEQNYDYLADIETAGVANWAEEHGFALGELAWIQPGYAATTPFERLEKGANGKIIKMKPANGKMYLAGEFTLLDSLPCLNIGVYENGQLSCLGNGIDGKINDIKLLYNNQGLAIVGDLINGGNHYPMAVYDTSGWTFHTIPGRPDAEGLAALQHYHNGPFQEVAIKSDSISGNEIWKLNGPTWVKQQTVHGTITNMASYYHNWYAGRFDSVTFHRTGLADTMIYAYNGFAIGPHNIDIQHHFTLADSSDLPDTITAIVGYGAFVYFGGQSHDYFKPSITRFLNGSLQTLLYEYELLSFSWVNPTHHPKIYDLAIEPGTGNLFIAGDMKYNPLNGTAWTDLIKYDASSGFIIPYNMFDSTITAVAVFEGDLIIGGNFTDCHGPGTIDHLARLYVPTSTQVIKGELALNVFPNPTTNNITIDLGTEYVDAQIEVSNLIGQQVFQQEYLSTNLIQMSIEGPSGMYLVKVTTKDGESILKVVKQG